MSEEGGASDPGAGDRPLVTLFVMAYRQEGHVAEAIKGAFAQTYSPLEIILSDDASPDGTFAVMERMAAAYDGPHAVRLNREPENLGIVRHVTRLAELASGRLVVHAAGDDISEPDRVARLAAPWIATGGRVKSIHSRVLYIDEAGAPICEYHPPRSILGDVSPLNIIRSGGNCIGATQAFDRSLIERFGPIPADCAVEDAALFFRAAISGGIAYVDAPLVRYRVGGLSQPQADGPGMRAFYTDAIKHRTWKIANCRSFLADMEKTGFPGRDACRAEARRQMVDHDFQIRLARGGPARRLGMIPEAAALALRRGSAAPLALMVKYLLGNVFLRYYDRRQAWHAFLPLPGQAGASGAEWRKKWGRLKEMLDAEANANLAAAEVEPGHPPDTYVYGGGRP